MRQAESMDSFLYMASTTNVMASNIAYRNCSFGISQAMSLLQVSNITITNVSIMDSYVDQNQVIYLYEVKDLVFRNLLGSNIRNTGSTVSSFIQMGMIAPWLENGREMSNLFQNVSLKNSEVQFLEIEGISAMVTQNNIKIVFQNVSLANISLKEKENLIRFTSFSYENFHLWFDHINLTSSHVDLGSFFKLESSQKLLQISQLTARDNMGNFFFISSEKSITVKLEGAIFIENTSPEALIYVSSHTYLSIVGSHFQDNYSPGRGSIIFAETSTSLAELINSSFYDNYAIQGGVFFAQIYGLIKSTNCTFRNNFAYLGGIFYQQSEGRAIFTNCTMEGNIAIESSIIYSINSLSKIEISGGRISRNGFSYYDQEYIEVLFGLKEGNTRKFSDRFIQQLAKTLGGNMDYHITLQYGGQLENYQIQIIKAMIIMKDGVQVIDQGLLLHQTSASIAQLDGIIFSNTTTSSSMIETESSIINFRGLKVENLTSHVQMIKCFSDTEGQISNVSIMNSNLSFLYITSSTLNLENISLTNSSLSTSTSQNQLLSLIEIVSSKIAINRIEFSQIQLQDATQRRNLVFYMGSSSSQGLIYISSSDVRINQLKAQQFEGSLLWADSFSDLKMLDSQVSNNLIPLGKLKNQQSIIKITSSDAEFVNCSFINITGSQGPAIFASSPASSAKQKSLNVIQSTFINNSATQSGGAIYSQDVDMHITLSNFTHNQALGDSGGSIVASCSTTNEDKCIFNISKNMFSNNFALLKGGSIYYDLYSPKGLTDNAFFNNSAQYGNDYASYAFRIHLRDDIVTPALSQLVSGGQIIQPLYIGIYDQEDQIVTIDDDVGDAYLASSDFNLQITGSYKQPSNKGTYTFDDIIFIAAPSYVTSVFVISNALNREKYSLVTGESFQDYILILGFRECISGEVAKNNKCSRCIKGTYSYSSFDSSCHKCFNNAQCEGGNNVLVEKGYWRADDKSTIVFKCPYSQACLGGVESKCAVGYSGLVCNICSTDENGDIYGREGQSMCKKCPPFASQIFQFLAVIVGLLLYTAYLLNSVLSNPLRNKPQTVLIRILTNYFQVIMIVKNFDLSWPEQVEKALDVFSFITSSLEILVSFDCMMLKSGLSNNTGVSTFYYKVIAYGVAPIFATLIAAAFWYVIYLLKTPKKQRKYKLKRQIIQTSFIIIYLLYPTITNLSLSLFNCVRLEDGEIYLKRDFSVKCWSLNHQKMAIWIGTPMILIWVVGFPGYIFMRLWHNRKRLNEKEVVLNFGLFFVGLDDHAYYWEVIVTNLRKIIFIICGTILSPVNDTVKVLIGVIIIYFQSQAWNNYRPYFDPRFNSVEFHSQFAAIITIMGGLFFVQDEVRNSNNTLLILFLVVLFYNIWFLVSWTRQFLNVIVRVHYKLVKGISCCKFLRKFKIDTYDKNLKLEKRRLRQEEREKKDDAILKGAKYVQILGVGNQVAIKLSNQVIGISKNFAEDLTIKTNVIKVKHERRQYDIVALIQGQLGPQEQEQGFADFSSFIQEGQSPSVKLFGSISPVKRGSNKLVLDEIAPDENSVAHYYNVKRMKQGKKKQKKLKKVQINMEHRVVLYNNLHKLACKAFHLDENPVWFMVDRPGLSHHTREESRYYAQEISGPLSLYEEDTDPQRVIQRNRAMFLWNSLQQKKRLRLKKYSNKKAMEQVPEVDSSDSGK
ncbi:hypothetical protein FGO68_gene396 [Halteria grandinella]|uniref:Uncharacterized protein n=1 Tax=Halteria grandinella TaxID=5974 RepID=A0A8J8P8K9_HALGN|nr:hypothetical protein FGO68_gene396 [Halteria grandinella]